MAEELRKYKQILKREDEKFQEAMRAEVSTSLPSKKSQNSGRTHVITHSTLNFAIFFQLIPYSLLIIIITLYFSRV